MIFIRFFALVARRCLFFAQRIGLMKGEWSHAWHEMWRKKGMIEEGVGRCWIVKVDFRVGRFFSTRCAFMPLIRDPWKENGFLGSRSFDSKVIAVPAWSFSARPSGWMYLRKWRRPPQSTLEKNHNRQCCHELEGWRWRCFCAHFFFLHFFNLSDHYFVRLKLQSNAS